VVIFEIVAKSIYVNRVSDTEQGLPYLVLVPRFNRWIMSEYQGALLTEYSRYCAHQIGTANKT
jgi:hypothetical protein